MSHNITPSPKASRAGDSLTQIVAAHSPYLARLITQHPETLQRFETAGAEDSFAALKEQLIALQPDSEAILMRELRHIKGKAALLVALADISGAWLLERVTEALSDIADISLQQAARFLLKQAAARREIELKTPETPEESSGLIILGMGKLGAHELNYSSDIDVIILFDPEKFHYRGRHSPQHLASRIALDLVRIMQERTADGYVFRTDLRLRPDPASTPPAISTRAAFTYYESVGQNWERAAMIKARAVAGDLATGEAFLKEMRPFLWRKHLDFAAINDIHSIKRQMDSRHGNRIELPGHNIKLGIGGIREIEFYAQIHQLIWGGRMPELRERRTCDTLKTLAGTGIIETSVAETLTHAYRFFRHVEHRLQMTQDEQTHSLPKDTEAMALLASFCGFDDLETFKTTLLKHLKSTHAIYAEAWRGEESLGSGGRLVFTGVEDDPETLETIGNMGFVNASMVSQAIQGWHRGHYRAMRSKRARELLTEITPRLLEAVAATTNPDAAFLKLDDFLSKLPAGVPFFALLHANPELLKLIATILGSAPALAEHLSRNPHLLDAVLAQDFMFSLPDRAVLSRQLSGMLAQARDFEEKMIMLRTFKNEKQFQAGLQLIGKKIDAATCGQFLTMLAECMIGATADVVKEDFARDHGHIPDGDFAVIALGKLGGKALSFSSDIDLIFVYAALNIEESSDGKKHLPPSVYYNRLGQRLITALTSLSKGGRLYDVDTRLRPTGKDGPLVVSVEAFNEYYAGPAWMLEVMALTRGRVIYGHDALRQRLSDVMRQHITAPKDPARLNAHVAEVREKIDREFGSGNPWNLKHVRGGRMDLDFIAQYLLLIHAHEHPELLATSSREILANLVKLLLIPPEEAEILIDAATLYQNLTNFLQLCSHGTLEENTAPAGLKTLLAESLGEHGFDALKTKLVHRESAVYAAFQKLFTTNGGHHDNGNRASPS